MSGNTINHRAARVLCSASCPVNHIDNASRITKKEGWPDIRGLNSLNASRTSWLAADAIEKSIAVYVRGFPDALQGMIGLEMLTLNPLIWYMPNPSQSLHHAQHLRGREFLQKSIMSPPRRLVSRLKRTEYSIFPLCVNNNHWVLVVLHKSQVPSANDPSTREWSKIVQATVIDPQRSTVTVDFVHSTMRSWFTHAAGFTFAPDYVKNVWVPLQRDNNSCGPRAYWNAKQILDRLLELHENGLNYDASLWSEFSGWFNEGFVREEMRGRCAAAAVQEMEYGARVAVEVVNQTREFSASGGTAAWGLAQMLKPEDMTGQKPESRPSRYRGNQLGGQGLEQLVPPENTHTPSYASGSVNTNNNSNNNNNGFQPPAGPVFIPPAPIPNQHRIAPAARPKGQDPVPVTDAGAAGAGSRNSMSPTFPPATPAKNPLIPPSTPAIGAASTSSTPGQGKQTSTDLTPAVKGLTFGTAAKLGPIPFGLGTSFGSLAPAAVGSAGGVSAPSGASAFNPIAIDDDDDDDGPSGSQPIHIPSPVKTPGKRVASGSTLTGSPPKKQKVLPPPVPSKSTSKGGTKATTKVTKATTKGTATGTRGRGRGRGRGTARGNTRGTRGTRGAGARGGSKGASQPAPQYDSDDDNRWI
ncbi:hypothetical protein F4679DRAFT_457944 [Xylaria curta]|nr:hypothetical protein F4679DRAFT_457944 [Xylaria curta]